MMVVPGSIPNIILSLTSAGIYFLYAAKVGNSKFEIDLYLNQNKSQSKFVHYLKQLVSYNLWANSRIAEVLVKVDKLELEKKLAVVFLPFEKRYITFGMRSIYG